MPRASTSVMPVDPTAGKDEMNLAEFPLSLLTNQEPDDIGPLVFEGRYGKLTITGSGGPREDGNGLPMATDIDVLIGLLQLTKRANDFTDPTVQFSRYELLKLIRWSDETRSYRRLKASLNRWVGLKLVYANSWYDKLKKCRRNATFHILESVVVYDRADRAGADLDDQSGLPSSTFTWNGEFFKSCKAGNLKRLDLDVYFSLGRPATKQLYRFLDKHFYEKSNDPPSKVLIYDLRELAVGHIGYSPDYTIPQVKAKLAPCLEELERIGFIEPATKEERYTKTGHGKWDIAFKRKTREQRPPLEAMPERECPLAEELIGRGVTPITARELVKDFPAEVIAEKLEIFDWIMAKKDRRTSKNPAGYLAKSIRDGFTTPTGFKSKAHTEAERLANEKAEQELAARRLDARSKDLKELSEKSAIDAHLASLTPGQRAELEREAYDASELNAKLFGRVIVRDHVRKLLGFGDNHVD